MAQFSFTEHPASVGETYSEHLSSALGFGLRMLAGGLACIVHGFLPFLFLTTGSRTVAALHERMITNRSRAGGIGRERGRVAGA